MNATLSTPATIQPAHYPDGLAQALVRSLGRTSIRREPLGPVMAVVLGAVSFGILPILSWTRRFAEFVAAEQSQLWHLAQWLAQREGAAPSDDLHSGLRSPVRGPGLELAMALVLMLIVVWAAGSIFWSVDGFRVCHATFGFGRSLMHREFNGHPSQSRRMIFGVWTVSLFAGYAGLFRHILRHRRRLVEFVARFNRSSAAAPLPAVVIPPLRGSGGLAWCAATAIGLYYGAFWAIPAAMAGWALSAYVHSISLPVRAHLALRVQDLAAMRYPGAHLRLPAHLRRRCQNSACCAALPDDAEYCPRCGTPAPALARAGVNALG